jgi:hypothetical protein
MSEQYLLNDKACHLISTLWTISSLTLFYKYNYVHDVFDNW